MSDRTYSEDEIRALMKRAAEIQRMQQPDHAPGLTVEELEHIAAESGIAPEHLRTALREADSGVIARDVSGHTHTHAFVERVVPGELSEDEWGEVVLLLRRKYATDMGQMMGMPAYGKGVTERLGSMYSWQHTSNLGVTSDFSIRSIDGSQHIRFERRVGMARPRYEGLGYGTVVAMVIAAISGPTAGLVTESGLAVIITLILSFFAALAISAPIIENYDRRWRNKVLGEMKEVTAEVAKRISDPAEGAEIAAREGDRDRGRGRGQVAGPSSRGEYAGSVTSPGGESVDVAQRPVMDLPDPSERSLEGDGQRGGGGVRRSSPSRSRE